jgi:hypothetical protein
MLVAGDVGSTIRVAVTGANSVGSSSATSAQTAVVTAPSSGSAPSNTAAPTIAGTAQAGQTLTASPGSWSGNPAPTFAYQWQRCGSACTDIAAATAKTYTLLAADVGSTIQVVVTASNSAGSSNASSAKTATVTAAPPAGSYPVLAAAGDIAGNGAGDEATAKLLDSLNPDAIATLGDNVYDSGSASEYQTYFAPTWGRHKAQIHPAPGNHDYHTSGASGYFGYWGAAAATPGQGWYSYNVGTWHIISINSNGEGACATISCAAGSAQERWLRADLAANSAKCTLAYWHHPRFSGGTHGDSPEMQAIWQALYDNNADLVLSGHDHDYQRFTPMTPTGSPDPNRGIREFVVGTGGRGFYPVSPRTGQEATNANTFGILALTLKPDSYDWRFIPEAGKTFTDTGSGTCH